MSSPDAGTADVPLFVPQGIGRTTDVDGVVLPTVVIDAVDTPEVADLARVHAVDGIGDIRTAALRVDQLVVLGISMTTPVQMTFAIALDVEAHRPLLDDVIECGSLVVAHTDPHDAERPHWLAVDIDGQALAAQIDAGGWDPTTQST